MGRAKFLAYKFRAVPVRVQHNVRAFQSSDSTGFNGSALALVLLGSREVGASASAGGWSEQSTAYGQSF